MNKLGDMILELRDPNLSKSRESEIVRLLNEIGDREQKYKALLQAEGTLRLTKPTISHPRWITSALSSLGLDRTTNTTITTGVDTVITWEFITGYSTALKVDPANKSIIRIVNPGQAFTLMGRTSFAANATGFRTTKIEGFDSKDASFGIIGTLHTTPGWAGNENITAWCALIPENIAPDIAYIKFLVGQTSGGNLTLNFINCGLAVA